MSEEKAKSTVPDMPIEYHSHLPYKVNMKILRSKCDKYVNKNSIVCEYPYWKRSQIVKNYEGRIAIQ